MRWHAVPEGRRGRVQIFSDAAIQFCLTIKGLFGLALRQAIGFVESLLRLARLDRQVPDYSTLCRRQKHLMVAIARRTSPTGFHLLVDTTGIKILGEGEWKTKKHGAGYRRQWRKVHLEIGAETMGIRAIEITDNSISDAPMLPELLAQTPAAETIVAVSGDGAYDNKGCYAAIATRGAVAVIPTRKIRNTGRRIRRVLRRTTRICVQPAV